MINKEDYLKDYRKMDKEEFKSYVERVDKWTDYTFPRLMASVNSWLEVPVKEFNEGLILASAVKRALPFIAAAENYRDAKVALRKIDSYLVEVNQKSGRSKQQSLSANDKRKWFAATEVVSLPDENGNTSKKVYAEPDVDGRRPQHVSQYIHLLPPQLQAEAAGLKQMHMELSDYREQAERLSENPVATQEQVSEMACKAVSAEQRIRTLYNRIDVAYKLATGQPVDEDELEDAGMEDNSAKLEVKRGGEYTKVEIDAMTDTEMQDVCKKARVDANKKYVRRELKVTPEYREQLTLRIRELMAWEESIPKKAYQKCQDAGVVIAGFNDDDEVAAKNAAEAANETDTEAGEETVATTNVEEKREPANTEKTEGKK